MSQKHILDFGSLIKNLIIAITLLKVVFVFICLG